jgi:hypothetical protein
MVWDQQRRQQFWQPLNWENERFLSRPTERTVIDSPVAAAATLSHDLMWQNKSDLRYTAGCEESIARH